MCDESAQGFVVNCGTGETVRIPATNSKAEVRGGIRCGDRLFMPEDGPLVCVKGGWQPTLKRGLGHDFVAITG